MAKVRGRRRSTRKTRSKGTATEKAGYGAAVEQESEVRTFDGSDNNRAHPRWGAVGDQLLRISPARYADGISAPAGLTRPNPLVISEKVCREARSTADPNGLTDMMWAWGQFLDHEIDLSPESMDERIDIPPAPVGGKTRKGIELHRSKADPSTGTSPGNPRQQINVLSAYIDASNVYGSNEARAAYLRKHEKGLMRTETIDGHELPPWNEHSLPNAKLDHQKHPDLLIAGDVRANEHAVLSSLHTLFVLEHNRLCRRQYAGAGKDEVIYQRARRHVGALMQVITYEEFLPALLGYNAFKQGGLIGPYHGYDARVNAGVSNLFSTACYRLGHSMLSEKVVLDGKPGSIRFEKLFFDPQKLIEIGLAPILAGLPKQAMRRVDVATVDAIRTLLFNLGQDLAARNIQRGRDHGLPTLNEARQALGLRPHASFAEVTKDRRTQRNLASAYDHVDDIDVWLGGLAEDHHDDASVGQLVYVVLCDQFRRLRDGDRFWYEHDPALAGERRQIARTRLSDVISRNLGIRRLRRDVFRLP